MYGMTTEANAFPAYNLHYSISLLKDIAHFAEVDLSTAHYYLKNLIRESKKISLKSNGKVEKNSQGFILKLIDFSKDFCDIILDQVFTKRFLKWFAPGDSREMDTSNKIKYFLSLYHSCRR